jgi:hypothetical protein
MRRVRLPSPATLIALLALFVALGVPAQAARLIGTKQIKRNAITARNIKSNAIQSRHVKNRSLLLSDLSPSAVTALTATPPNSIGSDRIADGAIGPADIAGGAVNGFHVADQTLQGRDIAPNAISGDELAAASVTTDEIAPNAVQGDEIENGRLSAVDVGSFAGSLTLDFPNVDPGNCTFIDSDVAAIANTTPPMSVANDAVLIQPPSSFPDDALVISAAPSAATKIRVRICNLNGGGGVDLTSLTYRYITFDF